MPQTDCAERADLACRSPWGAMAGEVSFFPSSLTSVPSPASFVLQTCLPAGERAPGSPPPARVGGRVGVTLPLAGGLAPPGHRGRSPASSAALRVDACWLVDVWRQAGADLPVAGADSRDGLPGAGGPVWCSMNN